MNEIGKFLAENPMAAVIAAGEIGFWVFIVAGLAVRYALHARRASVVLLAMVPVVDVVVLVATVIDLAGGAKANFTHGLAAVYLGFSVVFGPSMVRWADARFAHRFAGGPPPPPKRYGREKLRHEWREFGKCVLACGLAAAGAAGGDLRDRHAGAGRAAVGLVPAAGGAGGDLAGHRADLGRALRQARAGP